MCCELACILKAASSTDPNATLIFVPLQLLASCGPWVIRQRQNLTIYPAEQRIVQRIQFLLRRLLDFERIFQGS